MSALVNIEQESINLKAKQPSTVIYYVVAIATLLGVGEILWLSYPYALLAIDQWANYLNLTWAHDSQLVENLLRVLGLFWLSCSALFWGGWFLKRLFRKIKGLHWRVVKKDRLETTVAVISPEVNYLIYSCRYLVIVLLFFILQYPLQYIVYPL